MAKRKLNIDKATFDEWEQARKKVAITQPEVAKLLFCSVDSIKGYDSGRNNIVRGLYNYFLLATNQHPDLIVYPRPEPI